MNNKEIFENIKSSKGFKSFDIFLYAIVVLLIISLFLAFIIIPTSHKSQGFRVYIDNKSVVEFQYDNDFIKIDDLYLSLIEFDKDSSTIIVYSDLNKSHFNVIEFDSNAKKVWVKDANCSSKKDCVYFAPIDSDEGIIYCLPHNLKITSLNTNLGDTPVVG